MKTLLKAIPLFLFAGSVFAQQADPVLMTINNKPVLKSEFEYIYNKNNSNNSLDKKTLEEYVDLFVNFKLKVEEAKTQGLDTTKSFINELSGYRNQLTKPYLTDAQVDEDVLRQAYDRLKEDLEVSHILIRVAQNAAPADTLAALQKANALIKRLKTEDFASVAKEASEDQSAVENGGRIGWITGFRTVYPFETMAYNTPVGTISKPVRSSFGYHIIKVHNRRKSVGEILVAHIMRFTTQGNDSANSVAKASIDSIYQQVISGEDFGKLAAARSEDRGSAAKNGELPWFGTGRMVPEFENAAFELKNIGDISKPIQSAYGWHIIKLLDRKDLPGFDAKKAEIEKQVKRDERAQLGQKSFINKLKKDYQLQINEASKNEFITKLEGKTLTDSIFQASVKMLNKEMISFANIKFTQAKFADYLRLNIQTEKTDAGDIINDKLNAFVDAELLAFENTQLEKKYDDFRLLMQEYHDGILLFEVSNNEVWEKASKDTKGLAEYFEKNKAEYTWEKPHFKGRVILCKDKQTLKKAKALVKKLASDSIDKKLRAELNDSVQYVKIEKGIYVQGDNKYIDQEGFGLKTTIEPDKNYPFYFVVGKNLKNIPEDYTDVRGLVTADYQEYLEKQWIASLRQKFTVNVNQEVLKTVRKN